MQSTMQSQPQVTISDPPQLPPIEVPPALPPPKPKALLAVVAMLSVISAGLFAASYANLTEAKRKESLVIRQPEAAAAPCDGVEPTIIPQNQVMDDDDIAPLDSEDEQDMNEITSELENL